MNKLVFRKEEAQTLVEFLQNISLKNKISRLRNKLIKKLNAVVSETDEDRIELCKEYANKDENGEAIVNDGQYEVEDMEVLNREIISLYKEEFSVDVGELSYNLEPLFSYLDSEEFDMELSGTDAICYDRLLDAWEEANQEEKSI